MNSLEPVRWAVLRYGLAGQNAANERQRFLEPVEACAGRSPRQAMGDGLQFDVAGSQAEDRSPMADVIDRRRHLGDDARVPEGVVADRQTQRDPGGRLGPRGEGGPALEERLK